MEDIDIIPMGDVQDIASLLEDDGITEAEVIYDEAELDEFEEPEGIITSEESVPRWRARAQARFEQPSRRPRTRRATGNETSVDPPVKRYHFPSPEPPKPRSDGLVLELWGINGSLSTDTREAEKDTGDSTEKLRALTHYHAHKKSDISAIPEPTDAELMLIEQEADGEVDEETLELWRQFAKCLGVDPDLFFPERGASTKEARGVCQGCVVRDDCLEYALEGGEKFGIWGGLSERERRRIRRQRALARAAQLQAPRHA